METQPHCTVSGPRARFDLLWIALLTPAVLAVHGYHPWAEDGGIYVAGAEYQLQPSLFPHDRAFATASSHYSIFAQTVAMLVRLSHQSLAAILLGLYLLSTAVALFAALRIAQRCFKSHRAAWVAVTLFGAWWTLPVAGTSLLLMDPYVSARSLSTPLSLLAIYTALLPWRPGEGWTPATRRPLAAIHPAIGCGIALLVAALFHPLMAGYALEFVVFLRMTIESRSTRAWFGVAALLLLPPALVQLSARPESPAAIAAAFSRFYWFLSQWHWFEWLGLLGPVLIFAAVLRWGNFWITASCRSACRAALLTALFATSTAVLYARLGFQAYPVARLQPLRAFLLLYAVMIVLCGGALVEAFAHWASRAKNSSSAALLRWAPAIFVAAMAFTMFRVQRATFPSSIHLELPGRSNPNPWVRAFVWARDETPNDALFALDARYVNTEGEDGQTFRAIAHRSAIPDFSKDGGQAAIVTSLAPEWYRSALATRDLSSLSDVQRDVALQPFRVQWVILRAAALTAHPCPYRNDVVKVCRLTPSALP